MDTADMDDAKGAGLREKGIQGVLGQVYREAVMDGLSPVEVAGLWMLGRLKRFELEEEGQGRVRR